MIGPRNARHEEEQPRSALGDGHEGVFRNGPPGNHGEGGARFCRAAKVCEGVHRIGEEHHAEAGDDEVEARGGKMCENALGASKLSQPVGVCCCKVARRW